MLSSIERWTINLSSVMNSIATAWIFVIMFLMTGDVLGRTLFNHPITGTPEIVKISIVGIVFLQIPHTLWVGRHIRSDILLTRMSARKKYIFESILFLVGILFFCGIIWAAWGLTVEAWQIHEFEGEGALRVPTAPIRTIILIGSAVTALMFLFRIIENMKNLLHEKGA